MTALLLDSVTKDFGDKRAVDDLSFAVRDGEVFGFLGGNGAGKTTSLRMVLDIIHPTSGRIEILGRAPGRENSADLGFLPEERGLYRTMTALDTITYFGRLKGMTRNDARREGKALLDRFGLGGSANTRRSSFRRMLCSMPSGCAIGCCCSRRGERRSKARRIRRARPCPPA
jgi:ABC-2 type transport system ATP-binding protein